MKEGNGKEKLKHKHGGHRQRLYDNIVRAGLINLNDIQAVEAFLTFILPRVDVNPLAHDLLERFGDLSHILSAEISELASLNGLGETAAKKINVAHQLYNYVNSCNLGQKTVVKDVMQLLDLAESVLRFLNVEHTLFLSLSSANIITSSRLIKSKNVDFVKFTVQEFTSFINATRPSAVVVAHNHPYGCAKPTQEDFDGRAKLLEICDIYGINFIDSLIVGADGVYSHYYDKVLRSYSNIDLKDLPLNGLLN